MEYRYRMMLGHSKIRVNTGRATVVGAHRAFRVWRLVMAPNMCGIMSALFR